MFKDDELFRRFHARRYHRQFIYDETSFIETSFIFFERNVNYCLVNGQANSSLPAWERYKRQKVNNKLEKRCYFMTINRDYDDIRVSAISKEQEAGSD